MPLAVLTRHPQLSDRTTGEMDVYGMDGSVRTIRTLELAHVDKDGDGITDRGVSRIPAGTYSVVPHDSRKYPGVWRVENVEGRTAILLHAGNYPRHTHGCILLGLAHKDIDGDGVADLSASRKAVELLRTLIPSRRFTLVVRDEDPVAEVSSITLAPLA